MFQFKLTNILSAMVYFKLIYIQLLYICSRKIVDGQLWRFNDHTIVYLLLNEC